MVTVALYIMKELATLDNPGIVDNSTGDAFDGSSKISTTELEDGSEGKRP